MGIAEVFYAASLLFVQVAARYVYREDSARGIYSQIQLKGEIRAE